MEKKDGTYMDELTEALAKGTDLEKTGEEIFAGEIDADDSFDDAFDLDRILNETKLEEDLSDQAMKSGYIADSEETGELFGSEIGTEELFSHPKTDEERRETESTEKMSSGKQSGRSEEEKTPTKKRGLFGALYKLFANVPPTEEEWKAMPSTEEKIEKARLKFEEAEKKQEEKKEKAAAKKKRKAEEAKKKANEAKLRKKAKEEEKKLSKKDRELKRLQAEAVLPPEGRINKAGAAIVFLFFLLLTSAVVVGAGIFSYRTGIENASVRFRHRKYNEAFEAIRGIEVKDKDRMIKERVYTVMYVNKQLNSYKNFHAMEDYASALDSLIKGLERYNKYIRYAKQIGIERDLKYVRKQILEKLNKSYGISERTALVMMAYTDKKEYSEKVYQFATKVDRKMARGRDGDERKYLP